MASSVAAEVEARWPRWPDGEEGRAALDVVLDTPVDQAFLLLYGGLNDLRKAINEAAGDKDYSTTAWVDSAEAVQAVAKGPTPPPLASVAGLKPGCVRRASFSGTLMGSKYRIEELHRLLEAVPGNAYTVMSTVLTTAMHGEKFRPVVLAKLRALPDGRAALSIRTTILFLIKPNGFIRAMIDKGARDGQRKNFEALRKVLAQFTTVTDAAAAAEAQPAVATAAVEAEPAAEAAAPAAPAASVLETVVGPAACRHLQPWAAFLHGHLAALSPTLGDAVPPPALLALLGALVLLSALRLVVDMMAFVQHASAHPRDAISTLTSVLFRVVDVPDSMQEVLVSCLIFYTVRLLVNRLVGMLPSPPHAARPAAPSSAAATPAGGVPGGAAGAGRAAAAGTAAGVGAAGPAAVKPSRSEEQEAEGVKYEGYAEAIAAAQALSPTASNAASSAESAQPGEATASLAAKQQLSASSFSMKGFTKSLSDAFTPARNKKAAGVPAAGGVYGAAFPPLTSSPPAGRVGGEELPAVAAAVGGSGSTPASPPAPTAAAGLAAAASVGAAAGAAAASAAATGVAGTGASPSPAAKEHPAFRSLSDSEAIVGASAALAEEASGTEAGEGPAGTAQEQGVQRAPTGLHHAKSAGALEEPTGSSMSSIARKLRGVLSPTAQPSSPRELSPSNEASAAAFSERGALSSTAAQRDFRPAMPAHLAPELAGQAVIEEIFENQRLQPFRGWGHTWPGHFLPTDKVNHWSRREHEGFPVLASSDFDKIAPPLPEGWQWCEEAWHVDMSGQIIDACDGEGWSYGLDFGYVRHPFQPNSGKKKISDFVRRRRWIRTRVPLRLAPQARLAAIAKDSSSWSEAETADVEALAAGVEAAPPPPQIGSADSAEAAAEAAASVKAEAGVAQADAREGVAATAQPSAAEQLATGEGGDQQAVAAVLESIFAQVEATSAQASMQQALAQTLGSRSSDTPAVQPASPDQAQQKEQPASSSEPVAPLAEGGPGSDSQAASRQPAEQCAQLAQQAGASPSGKQGAATGQAEPQPAASPAASVPAELPTAAAKDSAPASVEGDAQAVLSALPGELQRSNTGGPEEVAGSGGAAGLITAADSAVAGARAVLDAGGGEGVGAGAEVEAGAQQPPEEQDLVQEAGSPQAGVTEPLSAYAATPTMGGEAVQPSSPGALATAAADALAESAPSVGQPGRHAPEVDAPGVEPDQGDKGEEKKDAASSDGGSGEEGPMAVTADTLHLVAHR